MKIRCNKFQILQNFGKYVDSINEDEKILKRSILNTKPGKLFIIRNNCSSFFYYSNNANNFE